jgi:hypothetical protein
MRSLSCGWGSPAAQTLLLEKSKMSKSTTTRAARSASAAKAKPSAAAAALSGIDSASPEVGTALAAMIKAGRAHMEGAAAIDTGRESQGSAQAHMVAALSLPSVMGYPLTFDVRDDAGNVIHHEKTTLGGALTEGFGTHPDGKQWKAFLTAYKRAVLHHFLGVASEQLETKAAESLLKAFIQKALPAAAALIQRGVVATVGNEGKLVFSGDLTTPEGRQNVEAMQKLGSCAKLAALGNEDMGKAPASRGTNETPATAVLTEAQLLAEALRIAKAAAEGKATLSEAARQNLVALSKVVSANARMFAG